MMSGAAMTPRAVTTSSTAPSVPATPETSSRTSACSRLTLYSEITGTKDWEKAPSANSRRRKFGILKATRKASIIVPAPKAWE